MANNATLGAGIFGSTRSSIQAMINRTCIVSYGIIKDIPADGVVTVELSVADSKKDLEVITCVLAGIASEGFTLNIKPTVGDKVLILFPNKFDPDMFDKGKNEAIITEDSAGYDLFSGIAILINQFKVNDHHNVITVENGTLHAELAYDSENNRNNAILDIDEAGILTYSVGDNNVKLDLTDSENGKISITDSNKCTLETVENDITLKTEKASIHLNSSGYLSYSNTDDNKTKITTSASGITIEDKNGCTIASSSTSVKINGKLEIKK